MRFWQLHIYWLGLSIIGVAEHGAFCFQRIVENHNLSACMNELLCLEYGEVRTQLQLGAATALFCALDNVHDAVEIASDDREIQVIMTIMF